MPNRWNKTISGKSSGDHPGSWWTEISGESNSLASCAEHWCLWLMPLRAGELSWALAAPLAWNAVERPPCDFWYLFTSCATSLPERNFSWDGSNLVSYVVMKVTSGALTQPLIRKGVGTISSKLGCWVFFLVAQNRSTYEAFSAGNMGVLLYVWYMMKVEWCYASSLFLSVLPFLKYPLFLCFVFWFNANLKLWASGHGGEREITHTYTHIFS